MNFRPSRRAGKVKRNQILKTGSEVGILAPLGRCDLALEKLRFGTDKKEISERFNAKAPGRGIAI
jgi:hypothetical protein